MLSVNKSGHTIHVYNQYIQIKNKKNEMFNGKYAAGMKKSGGRDQKRGISIVTSAALKGKGMYLGAGFWREILINIDSFDSVISFLEFCP